MQYSVCRQMFNDGTAHAQSLMQQVQQANQATAAAQGDTRAALERVEAAKAEARDTNMASMRITDELQRARQECKDLLVDNVRYKLGLSIICCKCLWAATMMLIMSPVPLCQVRMQSFSIASAAKQQRFWQQSQVHLCAKVSSIRCKCCQEQ